MNEARVSMDLWTPEEVLAEKGFWWCLVRFGYAKYIACDIANDRNRKAYELLSAQLMASGLRPIPPPNVWVYG